MQNCKSDDRGEDSDRVQIVVVMFKFARGMRSLIRGSDDHFSYLTLIEESSDE